jgi:hypothetical protein
MAGQIIAIRPAFLLLLILRTHARSKNMSQSAHQTAHSHEAVIGALAQ